MTVESSKTILLIEDEPDLVRLTVFRLKKMGYTVEVAEDGAAGLERIRALKPGLVLLDMNLPLMDGTAVCLAAKNDPLTSDIPIYLVTAAADGLSAVAASARADGFLIKPYEPADLIAIIERHIHI